MIDHYGIAVRHFETSRAFYAKALAPLGYSVMMEFGKHAGLGAGGKMDFWIGEEGTPPPPQHVAFSAKDRATVNAFHEAALAAGGTDNGPPGVRTQYHPNYYAAFVRDPDGHNIEAVCHTPG